MRSQVPEPAARLSLSSLAFLGLWPLPGPCPGPHLPVRLRWSDKAFLFRLLPVGSFFLYPARVPEVLLWGCWELPGPKQDCLHDSAM